LLAAESGHDPERAAEVLSEIERLARALPASAPLAELHAIMLSARGDHEGALAAYDRAVAGDPAAEGDTFLKRAIEHAHLGHVEEAFADASRAVERSPRLAQAWVARAVYRTHLEEDYAAALADVDQAIALEPANATAHHERSEILYSMEDYEGAYAAADLAVAAAPKAAQLYFERALCRASLEEEPEGWRHESLADCDRALDLGYRDPSVFVHKSILQQELEDPAALSTLDAGIAEHPAEAQLYYHRGRMRALLGDEDGKRADLAHASTLGMAVDD
jgi:tetratricopeptide (TPR) repeat protein